ncbi:MAG: hypothetical protein ACR2IE_18775 [Candidatus Sumerlaeaceae bacterium]
MIRIFMAASAAAMLILLSGCGNSGNVSKGDYASLINRSGTTGVKGNGGFAAGSDDHPGYVEFPLAVGSQGNWAPAAGNHEPVTNLTVGSRGLGIANDSGGIGIGIH